MAREKDGSRAEKQWRDKEAQVRGAALAPRDGKETAPVPSIPVYAIAQFMSPPLTVYDGSENGRIASSPGDDAPLGPATDIVRSPSRHANMNRLSSIQQTDGGPACDW